MASSSKFYSPYSFPKTRPKRFIDSTRKQLLKSIEVPDDCVQAEGVRICMPVSVLRSQTQRKLGRMNSKELPNVTLKAFPMQKDRLANISPRLETQSAKAVEFKHKTVSEKKMKRTESKNGVKTEFSHSVNFKLDALSKKKYFHNIHKKIDYIKEKIEEKEKTEIRKIAANFMRKSALERKNQVSKLISNVIQIHEENKGNNSKSRTRRLTYEGMEINGLKASYKLKTISPNARSRQNKAERGKTFDINNGMFSLIGALKELALAPVKDEAIEYVDNRLDL